MQFSEKYCSSEYELKMYVVNSKTLIFILCIGTYENTRPH